MKLIIPIYFTSIFSLCSQQVVLDKLERMPDLPSPYLMRDWKKVTIEYDSVIYNSDWTGDYLPVLNFSQAGTQYPDIPEFGLDTYVGWNSQSLGEAINVLPSLVSASLCGIDKSDQYGHNWILYSQNYFNKKNGEGIYLNSVSAGSGGDWWYDVMPNVFFYQIYDLYGSIGDADNQFLSIADQFLASVKTMGGGDTPWQASSMNYRAYDFKNEIPNPVGVKEPEAAGAYAWILYHAFKKTGEPEYLKGAEWCMEYLNQLEVNPSYELQLPYGVYAAAKMNAELNTQYEIEKMMNWVFDRGPLRGWGTTAATWSSLDMSGLVGENNENGNDYVFLLNGLHQATALLPAVRYDKRFAHAMAKYVLNLANATRFFYPGFLPADRQDGSAWSNQHDPLQVIAHEAIREQINGTGPIATGDAVKGQWAATNLSLYSSSSIGYLACLIDKTEVEGILKLDLTKTDFFNDPSYPTYLVYNPHQQNHSIHIELAAGTNRMYDVISESFLDPPTSTDYLLNLDAKQVVVLVMIDEIGEPKFLQGKLLIGNKVVDYQSSLAPQIFPPRIQSLAIKDSVIERGDTVEIFGKVQDKDMNIVNYRWSSSKAVLSYTDTTAIWVAPDTPGVFHINWYVEDATGIIDSASIPVKVVEKINQPPVIKEIQLDQFYHPTNTAIPISLIVSDPDMDSLQISWWIDDVQINENKEEIIWISRDEGIYKISAKVDDQLGGTDEKSISLLIRDFDNMLESPMIADYPFNGSALDRSGNALHGQVFGPKLTSNRDGVSASAYTFDGINDFIWVDYDPLLNFNEAISISLWFNLSKTQDKEVFLISHGSWQNRWKISLTPDQKIRWTIHFADGTIKDLDSRQSIQKDSSYQTVATYDGEYMLLFIKGKLESFLKVSGNIKEVELPMLIGQMLPNNNEYNFPGILDDIRLWDYARTPIQVEVDYNGLPTGVLQKEHPAIRMKVIPNPVTDYLELTVQIGTFSSNTNIQVMDLMGQVYYQNQWGSSTSHIISTTNLNMTSGVYLVSIYNQDLMITKKFIKQSLQ